MPRLVIALLLLASCAFTQSATSGDFGPEHLVECRELGGGWVFRRYESADGTSSQWGVSGGDNAETRTANGWDDAAIDDLRFVFGDRETLRSQFPGTDAQLDARIAELRARLDRMPSCLAEERSSGGLSTFPRLARESRQAPP